MSQVATPISDFSTDKLTDQGLRFYVSSCPLRHQEMLTKQNGPDDPPPRPFPDRDASVDTDDTIDMPPWLIDVLPRLGELAALQENWDSYGSPPPTLKLMGDALAIVQRAERLLGRREVQETLPTPSIVPLSGGGIQIEWQTPVKELELEFFENRYPALLAVDIATGKVTEGVFDASDCETVRVMLAWLISH